MTEFVTSDRLNNIFYGDIFKINDKGCLVFGAGKTKASRIASDTAEFEGNEIALDFACLTREDNQVYGHFEMEFKQKNTEDPIQNKVKLECFLRMLNEEETKQLFKNQMPQILEISYDDFLKLSSFNITFVAPSYFPNQEGGQETEKNPVKRMEFFKELTQNVDVKTFVVPWMEDVSAKGNLIKSYIGK